MGKRAKQRGSESEDPSGKGSIAAPEKTHEPDHDPGHRGEIPRKTDSEAMLIEETAAASIAPVKSTKGGYPYSIFFIVGNEFCERFSFYGMKAILPIYLTGWLGFTEATATTIIHSFNFSAYFFSLFGGILSDNLLGKFRVILYLSIVYCIGNGVMSVTSLPGVTGTPPHWWGMAAGLILIGVGTGGIKPCVASFGGDQFDPTETGKISKFFSAFYFAINAGSVLSMFMTPLLRSRVHCFGQDSCYPLAFGVPAILMFTALLVFVAGSRLYRKEPARNNVVLMFFALLCTALWRAIMSLFKRGDSSPATTTAPTTPRSTRASSHWLFRAKDKYEMGFIEDARRVVKVFTVFIPICIFWALYDQQGSWWVYQAVMMKTEQNLFGWKFNILPEQMGLANAILILVLIPIFSHFLYPTVDKCGVNFRALRRILVGMLLAMLSFIMAAMLQFWMSASGTFTAAPNDPAAMVCVSGCVNILWQLPQYFVITCAEVFLSITGLEFAYSQAPASMKSVCQAGWLLTVAGGNLIVILVTLIDPVAWFQLKSRMAWNFILWTGIMGCGTLLFAWLAHGYEYREDHLGEVDFSAEEDQPPPLVQTESQISFKCEAPLLKENQ